MARSRSPAASRSAPSPASGEAAAAFEERASRAAGARRARSPGGGQRGGAEIGTARASELRPVGGAGTGGAQQRAWGGRSGAPRAVAFVGWSGSGKTTLLEELVPALRRLGLRTGYLKSARHGFQMDREGKDSDRLFRSGAQRVAVASLDEGALRFRLERRDLPSLIAEHFAGCDLVVAEGFAGSDLPKIEVCRGRPLLAAGDPTLIALVSDAVDPREVLRFERGDLESLTLFVVDVALGKVAAMH